MYWLCMIATIPLATGNKLNCFISARGMLAIVWHCVLLFCCFLLCVFFVDFLHVNKSSSQKKHCFVTTLSPLPRVGKMPAFMSKVHAGGIYRYLPAFTGIYRRLLEFTGVY